MEPRDEGATRPARVEVGQRYKNGAGEITVRRRVQAELAWAYCQAGQVDADWTHDGDCCWMTDDWFQSATYLGTSAPPAPVGVAAGQRRMWNPGKEGICGSNFTVLAKGDMFAAKHDGNGFEGSAAPASFFEDHSTLIADAPTEGVTPGAPPFFSPGLAKRLKAIMAKPARAPRREVSRDGKQWVPYAAVEGVGYTFESYKHRRLDGVVAAMATEPAGIRIVGTYCGGGLVAEAILAAATAKLDEERRARNEHRYRPAPTPAPPLARRRFLEGYWRPWELP